MSWNTYVQNLEATGHVKKAAIFGLDGAVWAVSAGWTITPEEVKTLVSSFNDPSPLSQKGLYVGCEKFIYLSGRDNVLRGKKGQAGVHVTKSDTAIIIGYYDEPIQHSQCATAVDNVTDYLKEQNY